MTQQIADIERRLLNAVRLARITAVDPSNARARVTFGGDTESAWLQFSAGRAGGARVWAPPVVGEQVVVVCPSGDTAQGVILSSVPSDAFPAPSSDGGTYRMELPGGVSITIAGGTVDITAPGGVSINGSALTHNGVNVGADHVHGGITPGGADTSVPH